MNRVTSYTVEPLYSGHCVGRPPAYSSQWIGSQEPLYSGHCVGSSPANSSQWIGSQPLYSSHCVGRPPAYRYCVTSHCVVGRVLLVSYLFTGNSSSND